MALGKNPRMVVKIVDHLTRHLVLHSTVNHPKVFASATDDAALAESCHVTADSVVAGIHEVLWD